MGLFDGGDGYGGTPQGDLFMGRKLRDLAIRRLEYSNSEWIDWMRGIAQEIARDRGKVSTDDLHEVADRLECHPSEPRSYGAVFKPRGNWRKVGYIQSKRRVCHARPIPVWSLDEKKVEPEKPMCGPCAQGNCRGCHGHKVCGHYHAWEGEDEQRHGPVAPDLDPVSCGIPLTDTGQIRCKRLRGHSGTCWASR